MTGRKWTARGLRAALGCVALGCAGGAAAETLKISGTYPAGSREAAALTRMAVARFDGSDGPMLAREVERRLGEAQIDGARWFTLISASPRLGGGVDQPMAW